MDHRAKSATFVQGLTDDSIALKLLTKPLYVTKKGKKKSDRKHDLTPPDEPFKNPAFNPDILPDADLNTCLLTSCNLSLQGNCIPDVKSMQTILERKEGRGQRHQLKKFIETGGHRLPENALFMKLTKEKESR